MSSIDDAYRTRETDEAAAFRYRNERKRQIRLEVGPGLLAQYLQQCLANPPRAYAWVETPDMGKVVAWQLTRDYEGEFGIFLFQDGRIGHASINYRYGGKLTAYKTFETLEDNWLSGVIDTLAGSSEKYRCLVQLYWDYDWAKRQRRALGYDI